MHYLEIIGFTLDIVGKILIAFTAIQVHYRFFKEHKIDEKVFKEMSRERIVGIIGIILMLVGFFMQLPGKF